MDIHTVMANTALSQHRTVKSGP